MKKCVKSYIFYIRCMKKMCKIICFLHRIYGKCIESMCLLYESCGTCRMCVFQSMNAIIVFAVLLNRPKLVKVLLKYSLDPIPTIVFVETMYRGLYRHTNNEELRNGLKRQADEFGSMATDILDAGIRESPQRARTFFQRTIPAYNDRTTLEMAFDARNRYCNHTPKQNDFHHP